MSEDIFLHFISDQGVNKVSNNQNGSDVNNHLKKRKSISTSAMEGQRYKLLSCPYTNVFMHLFKGPSIIYVSTLGYLVGHQNADLVNRPYLQKMLTRVLTWSKIGKNVLT